VRRSTTQAGCSSAISSAWTKAGYCRLKDTQAIFPREMKFVTREQYHFTKPPQLRHAPEVVGQLFHAREVRAAPTEGLRTLTKSNAACAPGNRFRSTRRCTRLFQRVRAGEGVDRGERISDPGEI
jgi:hypothetical protein